MEQQVLEKRGCIKLSNGVCMNPTTKLISNYLQCFLVRGKLLNNDEICGDSPNCVAGSDPPLSLSGSDLSLRTFFLYILLRLQIGHAGFFGKWQMRLGKKELALFTMPVLGFVGFVCCLVCLLFLLFRRKQSETAPSSS